MAIPLLESLFLVLDLKIPFDSVGTCIISFRQYTLQADEVHVYNVVHSTVIEINVIVSNE